MEESCCRVLFVSGDVAGAPLWAGILRESGAQVTVTGSAGEALERWEREVPDLTIIDAATGLDELGICRTLRAQAVNPILLLAAACEEPYALDAYRAGADECIAKTIGPQALVAKLRAWSRHNSTVRAEALPAVEVAGVRLEPSQRQVVRPGGARVDLTLLELRLLHLLMSQHGQVLAPDVILAGVWGPAGGGNRRTVGRVLGRLRLKIEPDPCRPRYLCTVPRQGYAFCG